MVDVPVVPILSDGVITLRPFSLDDLDAIVEHCNDPEVVAYTTVPTPYTREDGLDWINNFVPTSWAAGTDLAFAIEAAHPDGVRRFAGGITLRPQPEGIAEIGFAVHFAVRGQGVGRRAITLITDWGFAHRGVEVVLWRAYVGNWGSRRVVWSSGFTIDGTSEKLLDHRGERRDAWVGTFRKGDTRDPKKPWLTPPVLETPRLRLRPLIDADGPRLVEINQDERSRHFGGRVPGVRQSDPQAAITRHREQCANGLQYNWCIADRATDQLVGQIQLFDLNGLDDTEAKPGYAIHPDSRGKGILTEALQALVEWTFRPVADGGLGRRRITISTAASNKASRHAAEVAGFTHAATLPTAFTLGETDFDDEVLYQITNPTWQG
jgi:[ribosomal protein S5]-alanine N-acetyltransferase